ncbi:MAG: hypothetical protein IH948_09520 [Bacteroidetes bacterium]|nr:hypothetical protein [Bacteroidota bacterium]
MLTVSSTFAQRRDTIPYGDSYVIANYNASGKLEFYEKSYYMKDSTWYRTYYSKGEIVKEIKNGIESIDTLYLNKAYLEKTIAHYPDGSIESVWFNKKKNKSESFQNWTMDSTNTKYFQDGQISYITNWAKNKKVGEMKSYYQNGQLQYLVIYKDDLLHNVKEYYSRNGAKLEVGTFSNGTGHWNIYNDEGKLIEVSIYENGKFRKVKKVK